MTGDCRLGEPRREQLVVCYVGVSTPSKCIRRCVLGFFFLKRRIYLKESYLKNIAYVLNNNQSFWKNYFIIAERKICLCIYNEM